jgi:hypothetical protein
VVDVSWTIFGDEFEFPGCFFDEAEDRTVTRGAVDATRGEADGDVHAAAPTAAPEHKPQLCLHWRATYDILHNFFAAYWSHVYVPDVPKESLQTIFSVLVEAVAFAVLAALAVLAVLAAAAALAAAAILAALAVLTAAAAATALAAAATLASSAALALVTVEVVLGGNANPLLQSDHSDHPNTFLSRTREKDFASLPYAEAAERDLLSFNTELNFSPVVLLCWLSRTVLFEEMDAH